MKLELLQENQADWSEFEKALPANDFHHLSSLVKALTKGMSFSHSTDKNKMTSFLYNNSLVEIEILASISGKEDAPYIMMMAQVRLTEKLMLSDKQKDMDSRTLMNFHLFLHDDNARKDADRTAETYQKTIDDFIEWYFDMSGEYGKVKLLQVQGSTVEGYSRGGENRYVAIAGDFCADKDPSNTNNTKETQARVF